ncbi:MAG: hypothetical protein LBU25_00620 [Treponema sp.]|jgi:hypothetical protein|nr:hypothetical protein [Treponema sp.]
MRQWIAALVPLLAALTACGPTLRNYTVSSTGDFAQALEKIKASQAAGDHTIILTADVESGYFGLGEGGLGKDVR